jgi:toxin HigB-1
MIKSFAHKGLEAFFNTGSKKGIQPSHAIKLKLQLAALGQARLPKDLNAPGWRLHELKGDLRARR